MEPSPHNQLKLTELQETLHHWRTRNFPGGDAIEQLLGVQEEVGELSHAHLKELQGIRTNENHYEEAQDAVGDIVIYLMGYCSYRNWNFEGILDYVSDKVLARDWQKDPVTGG